ncbi:MAG: pentapeptide repeat-containing protein [Anaerolineae bacterium]|nr:pentapeptide repeat-containing protein [Anaerolineae bacterium]
MSTLTLTGLLLRIEQNDGPEGLDLARTDLSGLDASPEAIAAELARVRAENPDARPPWLCEETGGINLEGANLHRANLAGARLPRANLCEADLERAHLSGADLREALLRDADLERAQLAGASLSGAILDDAAMHRADLSEANLQEASLRDARLDGANLRGALLRGARLQEADLGGADLRGTNLADASLNEAGLEGADLSEADLRGAALTEASMEGANLSRARLVRATLDQASLVGANLSDADASDATLREASLEGACLARANLQRADLGEARLEGADLRACTLENARLEGARLTGADLRDANLQHADLRDARLQGARLQSANLRGASLARANLQDADLRQANIEGADLSEAVLQGARAPRDGGGWPGHRPWGAEALASVARDVGEVTAEAVRLAAEAARHAAEELQVVGSEVEDAEGEFSITIPCEGADAVRLHTRRGNIELVAEERGDILVHGQGGTADDLEVLRSERSIEIRQKEPERRSGWHGLHRMPRRLDLSVRLPRTLGTVSARTGLGGITGRGLATRVDLSTGKGDIALGEGAPEGRLSTGLGSISVAGARGDLTIRTGSGDVLVQDISGGHAHVATGSGRIALRGGRLDGLEASSGAGDVRCACALGRGTFSLQSGAGVITVEMPADQAVQIEATSGMGQIKSDWPLVRVGRPGPAVAGSVRMVGSAGDEAERARLIIRTGMGNVFLLRAGGVATAQALAGEQAVGAAQASEGPEEPSAPAATGEPLRARGRLAILESLARGEISVDEAEELIVRLAAEGVE